MNHALPNLPQSRSWRDIPQQVKPRAMSAGGRRRAATATARGAGIAIAAALLAWGAWQVAAVLQENPKKMPEVAQTVAVKHYVLRTDGVLDEGWLQRTLALPANAALLALDLQQLQGRLLADGQALRADLTRRPPDTLEVTLKEREPVARVRAQFGGAEVRELLVARDGVSFPGAGFDPARRGALPWLDGVRLKPQGNRLAPIAGLAVVADLLEQARRETPRLYETWGVVSLARLESDNQLEVRTKSGTLIVFSATGGFFPQLAKLDYQWDLLARAPVPPARIDLSLGPDVPVSFAAQPATTPPAKSNPFLHFPSSPAKREL